MRKPNGNFSGRLARRAVRSGRRQRRLTVEVLEPRRPLAASGVAALAGSPDVHLPPGHDLGRLLDRSAVAASQVGSLAPADAYSPPGGSSYDRGRRDDPPHALLSSARPSDLHLTADDHRPTALHGDADRRGLAWPDLRELALRSQPSQASLPSAPQSTVVIVRLVDVPRIQVLVQRSSNTNYAPSGASYSVAGLSGAVPPSAAPVGAPARPVGARSGAPLETSLAAGDASVEAIAVPAAATSSSVVGPSRPERAASRPADVPSVRLSIDSAEGGLLDIGKPRPGAAADPSPAPRGGHADEDAADEASLPPLPGQPSWQAGEPGSAPSDDAIGDGQSRAATANAPRWAIDAADGGWIALAAPALPADAAAVDAWPQPMHPAGRRTPTLLADNSAIPIDVALGVYQAFESADEPSRPLPAAASLSSRWTALGSSGDDGAAISARSAAHASAAVQTGGRQWQLAGALSGALGAALLGNARREYTGRKRAAAQRCSLADPPGEP